MSQRHDNRLSVGAYWKALESVETQFALVRMALDQLSKARIKRFFKERLANENAVVKAHFGKAKEIVVAEQADKLARFEALFLEYIKKQHKKENKPADFRFKREFSEDRLNQSELLLLVAHFESFMKEVHGTFLKAAPAKVFSKRDTKVMLREVFDCETASPFGKFLKELIIKEVKFLDSQRIEQKAKYFSDHFGVSFGSEKEIDDLKEIFLMRNRIAREIYMLPPANLEEIKELALVSDEMLSRARSLFRDIPHRCVQAGARTYQSYFR